MKALDLFISKCIRSISGVSTYTNPPSGNYCTINCSNGLIIKFNPFDKNILHISSALDKSFELCFKEFFPISDKTYASLQDIFIQHISTNWVVE